MSKELAIKVCLHRIHTLCGEKRYQFLRREKNMQTLSDLGLTENDAIQALMRLKMSDYISGPEADYDGTDGQIWKFSHPISGETVYIKLKFFQHKGMDRLKIISFHM
jgi:hypothetical protein